SYSKTGDSPTDPTSAASPSPAGNDGGGGGGGGGGGSGQRKSGVRFSENIEKTTTLEEEKEEGRGADQARTSKKLSGMTKTVRFGGDDEPPKQDSGVRTKRKMTAVVPSSTRPHSKSVLRRKTQYSKRSILKGIGLNRSKATKQRRSIFFDNDIFTTIATFTSLESADINATPNANANTNANVSASPVLGTKSSPMAVSTVPEHLRGNSALSDVSFGRWMRGKTIDNYEEAEDPPFWENDRALYGALMSVQIIAEFMNEYKASSECRSKFMKMVKYFTRFVKNHTFHKNWSSNKFYEKANAKLHTNNYNLYLYEHYLTNQKYFAHYQANLTKKKLPIPRILPPPLQAQPWNWVSLASRSANIGLSTSKEHDDEVFGLPPLEKGLERDVSNSADNTKGTDKSAKPGMLKKVSYALGRRNKEKEPERDGQEHSHSQDSFKPFTANSPPAMEKEQSTSHSNKGVSFVEDLVEMSEVKLDESTKVLHRQMNEEFTLEMDPIRKVGFCYTKNYTLKNKSKQWKNRYFIVRGRMLFRYTLKDDVTVLDLVNCHAKAFDLSNVKVEMHDRMINYNGVNLFSFTLAFVSPFESVNNKPAQQEHKQYTSDHPPLHLACLNAADRNEWVAKIQECSEMYQMNAELQESLEDTQQSKVNSNSNASISSRYQLVNSYRQLLFEGSAQLENPQMFGGLVIPIQLFLGNDIIIICDRTPLLEEGGVEERREDAKGYKGQTSSKKQLQRPTFLGGLFNKGQENETSHDSTTSAEDNDNERESDGEDEDAMLQRDFSEFYKLKFIGAIPLMEIVNIQLVQHTKSNIDLSYNTGTSTTNHDTSANTSANANVNSSSVGTSNISINTNIAANVSDSKPLFRRTPTARDFVPTFNPESSSIDHEEHFEWKLEIKTEFETLVFAYKTQETRDDWIRRLVHLYTNLQILCTRIPCMFVYFVYSFVVFVSSQAALKTIQNLDNRIQKLEKEEKEFEKDILVRLTELFKLEDKRETEENVAQSGTTPDNDLTENLRQVQEEYMVLIENFASFQLKMYAIRARKDELTLYLNNEKNIPRFLNQFVGLQSDLQRNATQESAPPTKHRGTVITHGNTDTYEDNESTPPPQLPKRRTNNVGMEVIGGEEEEVTYELDPTRSASTNDQEKTNQLKLKPKKVSREEMEKIVKKKHTFVHWVVKNKEDEETENKYIDDKLASEAREQVKRKMHGKVMNEIETEVPYVLDEDCD
ncbi:hypothetical protein RFI_24633, partial [Reticulomyxa filosa]